MCFAFEKNVFNFSSVPQIPRKIDIHVRKNVNHLTEHEVYELRQALSNLQDDKSHGGFQDLGRFHGTPKWCPSPEAEKKVACCLHGMPTFPHWHRYLCFIPSFSYLTLKCLLDYLCSLLVNNLSSENYWPTQKYPLLRFIIIHFANLKQNYCRLLAVQAENALRRHGLKGGLPYWDWTMPLTSLPALVNNATYIDPNNGQETKNSFFRYNLSMADNLYFSDCYYSSKSNRKNK